ncbi:FKBP-type peptidyl-prolyl cis-trans isomerase [Hymenobacter aquaticus]|uniref:Peptidyl-prolyl cis-trans isomerase n=1 Tax=Hymenobacter aquaticus TaxID=1867101 RepID=A0A4Z0Q7G6_9BACT|nr:FKBP-type peptidyl-prolyl cis-trans isomerase [Hymenobacter aquaticus]TGE26000.1 FKBP-type peptidyl-prolyl cis-trans isomerase [Hymenobacter aquaticus]
MKNLLSHSLVTRLTVLLLAVAPVFSACNTETDAVKQAREHEEEYKKIDDALIQDYFTRHGITSSNYQRTDEGLYIINVKEGAGNLIVKGNTVQVKYIGKYIKKEYEDVVFDKSYGNRTICECTEVIVGSNNVIQGWEKVLLRMKPGDQKRVFIPSYLAYGQYGKNPIPGDEPLQFDMEIANVK